MCLGMVEQVLHCVVVRAPTHSDARAGFSGTAASITRLPLATLMSETNPGLVYRPRAWVHA